MKKNVIVLCLSLFLALTACKNEGKDQKQATDSKTAEEIVEIKPEKRTYAEISIKEGGQWNGNKYEGGDTFVNVESLKVPEAHTDHSYFIRYEGPGWESSKVGYRLYLDWRNAIDVFGKKTNEMVLSEVGQDNFDSYHEMSDWGMDVLKAGKSMGIGSVGRFVNGEVLHFNNTEATTVEIENTASQSKVMVDYKGWETAGEKIDLSSELSIKPDQRITQHTIIPSEAIEGICTGIVKFEGIPMVQKVSDNGEWAYIATYGEQSLVPDQLGMVVFYKTADVSEVAEWQHDHLLVFKPSSGAITYYFAAAWEKEKNGITNKEDFMTYCNEKLTEFAE